MITEDQLEQLAIQWFQDTGWNYVHGAVIAPEGVAAEREDFRAVVLKGRLAEAVLRSCFRWIKTQHSGNRIGLPKIGAGLADGDWGRISGIIPEELAGEDVTLVEFKS